MADDTEDIASVQVQKKIQKQMQQRQRIFPDPEREGPESNLYLNSDKDNEKPKRVVSFDVDGTLKNNTEHVFTENGSEPVGRVNQRVLIENIRDPDTLVGLTSRRKNQLIFKAADQIGIKPDFVCSGDLDAPYKEQCLKRLKNKYPEADEHIHVGDSNDDHLSAQRAGFTSVRHIEGRNAHPRS